MGITFSHRPNGKAPTVQPFILKSGVTNMAGGKLANIESGTVDLAASSDSALAGLVLAPVNPDHDLAAMGSGTSVEVITDPDAVYRVTDANAREAGATLDINATGDGVTTSSNADVVVTAKSSASEPTHFKIANTQHFLAKV